MTFRAQDFRIDEDSLYERMCGATVVEVETAIYGEERYPFMIKRACWQELFMVLLDLK